MTASMSRLCAMRGCCAILVFCLTPAALKTQRTQKKDRLFISKKPFAPLRLCVKPLLPHARLRSRRQVRKERSAFFVSKKPLCAFAALRETFFCLTPAYAQDAKYAKKDQLFFFSKKPLCAFAALRETPFLPHARFAQDAKKRQIVCFRETSLRLCGFA